tara:strand:+ start:546 stop:776 length:231 start_codon:yes stop_codon:yes gene_type:complete
MSVIMENSEFVKTLSKEEVFDMWVSVSDKNRELINENYRLKEDSAHWRRESDKFERFWNSTKIDEDYFNIAKERIK